MRYRSLAVAALAVMCLSACGGGGGGSSPSVMTPRPAPLPTEAELQSRVRAILDGADGVLATDNVFVTTAGEIGRQQTVCAGTGASCSTLSTTTEEPLTFTAVNAPLHEGFAEVEFADIQRQNGVVVAASRWKRDTNPDTWVYGWGGWLDHSYFATHFTEFRNRETGNLRAVVLNAYSIGDATGTNPVAGSATWAGAMNGMTTGATEDGTSSVFGNATLTFDFAQVNMDVAFTQIRNIDTNQGMSDMHWNDLRVLNGRFGFGDSGDRNSIDGLFYGPNHEEVGGVFERNQVIGAFGAKRQ